MLIFSNRVVFTTKLSFGANNYPIFKCTKRHPEVQEINQQQKSIRPDIYRTKNTRTYN